MTLLENAVLRIKPKLGIGELLLLISVHMFNGLCCEAEYSVAIKKI